MCWLAGNDPLKLQAFEKMPLLEYFLVLDKHISDLNKELKKSKSPNA